MKWYNEIADPPSAFPIEFHLLSVNSIRLINERVEHLIWVQPHVYMHDESKSYWEKAQTWNKRESYSSTDAIAWHHHLSHDCLGYPSVHPFAHPSVHLLFQILCLVLRHFAPILSANRQLRLTINSQFIFAQPTLNSIKQSSMLINDRIRLYCIDINSNRTELEQTVVAIFNFVIFPKTIKPSSDSNSNFARLRFHIEKMGDSITSVFIGERRSLPLN